MKDPISESWAAARAAKAARTAEGAAELLEDLLAQAEKFPLWVLSFGGGKLNHEDCRKLVAKFRHAEIAPIRLRYRFGTAIYGDSGKEREILIVGMK